MGEKVRGRNERKRGFYARLVRLASSMSPRLLVTATTTTTTNYARRLIGLIFSLLAGISERVTNADVCIVQTSNRLLGYT